MLLVKGRLCLPASSRLARQQPSAHSTADMNSLDGKIAFVSGGARGIGAETARLLVDAGARVVIGNVLDERGRETARALEAAGGQVFYVHLNVTRAASSSAPRQPA